MSMPEPSDSETAAYIRWLTRGPRPDSDYQINGELAGIVETVYIPYCRPCGRSRRDLGSFDEADAGEKLYEHITMHRALD